MKMNEITRRELLKKVSLYMGGSLTASTIVAALSGCGEDGSVAPARALLSWKPGVFSPAQAALVSDLAETIIPRTDTPGAKDVGVPQLIDSIVAEVFTSEQREEYLAGLTKFAIRVQNHYGTPFSTLDDSKKNSFVTKLNAASLDKDGEDPYYNNEKAFYRTTKELTLLGFFRSEVGATQVLQYSPVPGEYKGCVPLRDVGKTWATS